MNTKSPPTATPQVDQDVKMAPSDENQKEPQKLKELIAQWDAMTFEDSALPTLVQKVQSNDAEDLFYGLIGLRKLLSKDENPPVQAIIDTGIVPRLIQLTSVESAKEILIEAAWCLTNLCSGTTEQTLHVIQNGAVASFLSLLKSDNPEVAEESIWGLGNIAGDNAIFRDLILLQDGIAELVKVLSKGSSYKLKLNGAWALSNLCRGKPEPQFERIFKAIPQFCEYLATETDPQILIDVAWGLNSLTKNMEGVDSVLSYNVVPKLIELCSHPDIALVNPCLKIIGNLVSGSDEQTSVVLKEKNLLPELFKLASSSKKVIRREVFFTLSNITAGPPAQFETIMGNPEYVEKLIHAAKNDISEVKKEALYALSNSTAKCTPAQIIRILENGVFGCLIDLLDEDDPKFLCVALEGVENCLRWGSEFNMKDESGMNKFAAVMEYRGALEKIDTLQSHENNEVYEKASKILTTYFDGEQEQEKEG